MYVYINIYIYIYIYIQLKNYKLKNAPYNEYK